MFQGPNQNVYETMHRMGILVDRPSRSILRQTEGLRYSDQDWTLVLGFELILHTESVHRFSLPLISFSVPPHQLSLHPPIFLYLPYSTQLERVLYVTVTYTLSGLLAWSAVALLASSSSSN